MAFVYLDVYGRGSLARACVGTGVVGRGCISSSRRAEGGALKDPGRRLPVSVQPCESGHCKYLPIAHTAGQLELETSSVSRT